MGIYDRDYIRQNSGILSYFSERGMICKYLIVINIVLFFLQVASGQAETSLTDALMLDVKGVEHGQIWRLLTYAFLHDPLNIWHIVMNMLFLWWFGSDVEDIYGPREFLVFYLLAALLGGIAFTLTHLTGGGFCLGASGAVTAVMVLCALHYPTRIILLFMILPVPIWMFVLFSVAQDLFQFLGPIRGSVAVGVHLAGALFGFLYWKFHWRLTGWATSFWKWQKTRRRPHLRVYREDEESTPTPVPAITISKTTVSKPTQVVEEDVLLDEVDAVLEKLSRVGKDNLTEGEKDILQRASELFRRRRK